MTTSNSKLKEQIHRTLAWLAFFPIVALWPFISTFPAFSLVGASDIGIALINIGFLLTGFWAIIGALSVIWFILGSEPRSRIRGYIAAKRLFIGIYASLWTALYALFAFAY